MQRSFVILLPLSVVAILYLQPAVAQNIFDDLLNQLKDEFSNILATNDIILSDPIVLANSSSPVSSPALSATNQYVYVSWLNSSPNGSINLSFTRSDNAGNNFSKVTTLYDEFSPSDILQMSSGGKNAYLLWVHTNKSQSILSLKVSNDNGISFGHTVDIGPIARFEAPQISAAEDRLYIAWIQEHRGVASINAAFSSDSGLSFKKQILYNSSRPLSSLLLIVEGSDISLAWKELVPDKDKFYLATTGIELDSPKVMEVAESDVSSAHLFSASNSSGIVWQDGDLGDVQIFLKSKQKNSSAFGSTKIVGNKSGLSEPLVSSSGGNIYLGWVEQGRNQSELRLKISNNSAETFNGNGSFHGISAGSRPQVLNSDNNVFISWTNSTGIFFVTSTNFGKDFNQARILSRNSDSEVALLPMFVLVKDHAYVSWQQLFTDEYGNLGYKIIFVGGVVSKAP